MCLKGRFCVSAGPGLMVSKTPSVFKRLLLCLSMDWALQGLSSYRHATSPVHPGHRSTFATAPESFQGPSGTEDLRPAAWLSLWGQEGWHLLSI